jgi:hypothetical protein
MGIDILVEPLVISSWRFTVLAEGAHTYDFKISSPSTLTSPGIALRLLADLPSILAPATTEPNTKAPKSKVESTDLISILGDCLNMNNEFS